MNATVMAFSKFFLASGPSFVFVFLLHDMDNLEQQFKALAKALRKELHEELNEQISSIRNQEKRDSQTADDENDAEKRPLKVYATVHEPTAIRRQKDSSEKCNRRIQIWLAIGTWLAFTAAAIYAGIAAKQLIEMRTSTDLVGDSIKIAGMQATLAANAIKQTQFQFIQDQRPYIWPNLQKHPEPGVAESHRNTGSFMQYVHLEGATQGTLLWTFHYMNFGKSPAKNFRLLARIVIEDGCAFKNITLKDDPSAPESILIQGQDQYSTATKPIAETEYQSGLNKNGAMCVFGRAVYAGLDGTPYQSDFCFTRLASGATANCPKAYSNMK